MKALRLFALSVLAAALLLPASFADAGSCLKDKRVVTLKDGSVQLSSYLCQAGSGEAAKNLRIEFHRLSESAAGSLLMKAPGTEVRSVLGSPRLLLNDVGREALRLFQKYGLKRTEDDCFRLDVKDDQSQSAYTNDAEQNCRQQALWYFSFPDREGLVSQVFPQPRDVTWISQKTDWPAGYRFFYKPCDDPDNKQSIVACTRLWRYLEKRDFDLYRRNLREYALDEQVEVPEAMGKYLGLVKDLSREGLPADFLVMMGEFQGCGSFDFAFFPRALLLETMLIENLSGETVRLDSLIGKVAAEGKLRKGTAAMRDATLKGTSLRPGERLLVPLQMKFVQTEPLREQFDNVAGAGKLFSQISSAAPGSVFEQESFEEGIPPIRKTKASFRAPEVPAFTDYVYGPELRIDALVVDGERITPAETSGNFLKLTAGSGYGSCPHLYSYDSRLADWVHHGKIIHTADSRRKQTTEEITMPGFVSSFRLAEEEYEIAHIDRARLSVTMKNGNRFDLRPDIAALGETDGVYASIAAAREIAFRFELPAQVRAGDVATSQLAVTGYYERYGTLLMTAAQD